jgi:transcription elongation factor Elf1
MVKKLTTTLSNVCPECGQAALNYTLVTKANGAQGLQCTCHNPKCGEYNVVRRSVLEGVGVIVEDEGQEPPAK